MTKMTMAEAGRLGAKKSRATQQRLKRERRSAYEQSPKLCLRCSTPIAFDRRRNRFCSHSCSASSSNSTRTVDRVGPKTCHACGVNTSNAKFCSRKCQSDHGWSIVRQQIEATGSAIKNEKGFGKNVKRYLKETRGHRCEVCQLSEWRGEPIPLILDHISGNSDDWRLVNLRLVCGNCDMQLPTYKSKNWGKGRAFRRHRYAEGKSY